MKLRKFEDYHFGENAYEAEKREEMARSFEEAKESIRAFEEERADLLENHAEMSDEEFDRRYEEASKELFEITLRVNAYLRAKHEERQFTLKFSDIAKVENLDTFLKELPLQFIPRKEEVGRMLALAQHMHQERVSRNEKGAGTPLQILDIGGANGALGKLVVDLAKENDIDIEYHVVDPDKSSALAADHYKDHPELNFSNTTGDAFNQKLHADNPDIVEKMKRRSQLIADGEKKKAEFNHVIRDIVGQKPEKLDVEAARIYLKILRTDFDLELDENLADEPESLQKRLRDDWFENADKVIEAWDKEIQELTETIQEQVADEPAAFDLVINSWAPPGRDLTKEVHEANGAAILYAAERYGATGCREDAYQPNYPHRLGDGESYNPGKSYVSRLGWVSHSTPQAIVYGRMNHGNLWNETMDRGIPPYSNGFIVQTRKTFGEGLDLDPKTAGIKIEGSYPWEEELAERGGDISPVIALKDKGERLEFDDAFYDLAEELGKKENDKKKKA